MNATTVAKVLVLITRPHADWNVTSAGRPLFVCAEMFLELKDIEERRWSLWAARESLRAAGHQPVALCDFLRPVDIDWLEEHAARFASGWYRDSCSDRTLYRGVSLGSCLEYDVKARAIRLLKLALCLQRLIEAHPQARLIFDFEAESTEARLLAEIGAESVSLGTNAPPVVATGRGRPAAPRRDPVLARARDLGLKAMRGLSSVGRMLGSGRAPVIVVRVGMQSIKMLERWLEAPNKQVRVRLWMDYLMRPRAVLAMVRKGATFVAPPPCRSAHPEDLATARRGAIERPPGRNVLPGLARGDIVGAALDRLASAMADRDFGRAGTAVDGAFEALTHKEAAVLVIPNDCQLVMRAWTLVARQCGTTTVVLQHGHLDYTEDGDHKCADYSAFWSPAVAAHYLADGLRADQIVITGSPNADEYAARRVRAPDRATAGSARKPHILVITTGNPGVQAYVEETWVCDYIVGVLDALAPRLAEFSIEIKLHPGESSALYRRHLDALLPESTYINDRGDLGRLLRSCDLVISPPSTVVIEARAAGTPVIMLPMPSINGRRSSLQDAEGVVTVSGYADLVPAIDEILRTGRGAQEGTLPLEEFLGPLDGMSSERVLKAVETLATASARAQRRGESRGREAHVD